MEIFELVNERHSVRSYMDEAIEGDTLKTIKQTVNQCNEESGLNIQLCINEPNAFSSMLARYGKFTNVNNYVAIVGDNDNSLEEKGGYYGEKIVMEAQRLGLNTCWVAMTFSKNKTKANIDVKQGQKLLMVIAIGYGTNQGVVHKVKPIEALSNITKDSPEWFKRGIIAAQLAPTAMNQQKFRFVLEKDNIVKAYHGSGIYTKVDLGIAKYHFEICANNKKLKWE
ncbi:MAG: nitroreductase family protein [Suipraeoptans sp.]